MYDQQQVAAESPAYPIGRRLAALLGVTAAGAAAALTVALPATAAAASPAGVTCRISVLADPADGQAEGVTAGDPTGRFLVGDGIIGARRVQLIWVDGKVSELATPNGTGTVTDVNAHGVAIGIDGDGPIVHGFVNRQGVLSELPPLVPGDHVNPRAINGRGDIVGTSQTPFGDSHAVIWPADRPGTVRELPVAAGQTGARPSDIDDDGTVVGSVYFADHADSAYVWPRHGRPYALSGPAGTTGPNATVIRHGWLGGSVNDPLVKPVRWNLRTHRVERVGLDSGWATAINRDGTVATPTAIAHRGDRVVALPGLSTVGRWYSTSTLADNGTAAGGAIADDGGRHAVIWHGC